MSEKIKIAFYLSIFLLVVADLIHLLVSPPQPVGFQLIAYTL